MKYYDVEVEYSGVFATRVFAASEEEAKEKAVKELYGEVEATRVVKAEAYPDEKARTA